MMNVLRRSRRILSVGLLAGLIVAGFVPAMVTGGGGAALAAPDTSTLAWEPCDDVADAECAFLEVPIDPAQPDGAQVQLRIARLPALDPDHRQGSLLLIPGGPGVGIMAAGGQFGVLRDIFHTDELRKTFDVVTYDPRGVGQSNPIRCASMDLPNVSVDALAGVMSEAEYETLAQANAAFAESCFAATGELMGHLSAIDAASDIEHIRQALGQDDGLVAYAGSYGTLYATAYLEQYGDNVKALILDGVVDHSIELPPYGVRWITSTEDGFSRFEQWCAEDDACALHGQDISAVFNTVAAAHPEVRATVRARLSAGSTPDLGWPFIADMLAEMSQAGTTPATPMAVASPTADASDPALVSGELGLFRGVLCADYGPQDDFAALAADNEALARQATHFAWLYSLELPGSCAGWPREASNPPHRLQVGSHPNVLVANPTHDPATPLVAAVAVWSQIPQARLLIADTDGHQALPFSRCAFETQVQFLTDPSSLPTTSFCPD